MRTILLPVILMLVKCTCVSSTSRDLEILTENVTTFVRKVGTRVTLPCQYRSATAIRGVQWYRNESVLDTRLSRISGGQVEEPYLTISNLIKTDTGIYKCFLRNMNFGRGGNNLNLTVVEKILFVSSGSVTSFSKPYGSKVTLPCQFTSLSSPPTITWYKDSVAVDTSRQRFSGGTRETPSLTIEDVVPDDRGYYICSATLGQDTVNGSALHLYGKDTRPHVFKEISNTIDQPPGSNVTLPCNVTSSTPVLDITWYANGVVVNTSSERISGGIPGNPSLNIHSIVANDTGSYICSATNAVGTTNGSTLVLNVEVKSADLSKKTIAIAIGIGVPALLGLIVCCRQAVKWIPEILSILGCAEDEEESQDEKNHGPYQNGQQPTKTKKKKKWLNWKRKDSTFQQTDGTRHMSIENAVPETFNIEDRLAVI